MNKASRRDAIPAKLFQILRAVHNISANFENSSVASGLEKAQFSSQSQREAIPKNV